MVIESSLTLSYTRVQILLTLFYNTREYVHSHEWQIEALAIPVSLNSAKHRFKKFFASFIFIKWSSINYNLWPTFVKKPAAMDLATASHELTLLTSGNSYWSGIVGILWEAVLSGYTCVVPSLHSNQKFIVVATLRMVGNRWLWSIMLVNANDARKSRVGYSRLPTEFFILETQLQATMIIVGISKCTQHVCESGRNSSILDDSQLLAGYHWHFHAYPMIQSVYVTDYCLNFENKHTHTRTRAGDNLQYYISNEWNILKCAHDFLKCMLCLA